MLRTHTCGELNATHVGKVASLCGWVQVVRDHGGLLFLDLRDRYGITQVSVLPEDNPEAAETVKSLTRESVIRVTGTVRMRPAEAVNRNIATGAIEVKADSVSVITRAESVLPIEVSDDKRANEEIRLKYRYIDL
ncbi:MAG TPA: OB-fold nucleic acid binding domain-containing protein, partial [Bacillota bacterium]|nr:OB-fold nucleic acid binding domain-containing protein [Bacillota bacterium]